MNCVCIENQLGNTNFTLNKRYEVNEKIGVRCNWGNMWCHFEDYNKPSFELKSGNIFEFGMCKFKVC